jgi:spermidine/putrescine-binding protein
MKLWWDSGDQMEQALRAGDVGMGVVYSGRAYLAKDSGANVAIHWSGVHGPGIYSVVQDAPHKEAAWRYLDWVATHPEAQAAWATALNYSVPHPDAFKHMPEERAKRLADYPPNRQGLGAMDFDWYVQNRDEISRRWQEFLQR